MKMIGITKQANANLAENPKTISSN